MKVVVQQEVGVVGKQFELSTPEVLALTEKWNEIFAAIFNKVATIEAKDTKVYLTALDVQNILDMDTFMDKIKGDQTSLSEARIELFEDNTLTEAEMKEVVEHP